MTVIAAPTSADPRKFFIRNIPISWTDWELFDEFRRFGLIDNVRVCAPANPAQNYCFGFVEMIDIASGDNVRNALKGDVLAATGATLLVSAARGEGEPVPPKRQQRVYEKQSHRSTNESKANNALIHNTHDLPLGYPQEVRIVSSPSDARSDTFTFHVLPHLNYEIQKEYNILRNKLVEAQTAPCLKTVKSGDPVLVACRGEDPVRGRVITATSSLVQVYLVDVGVERNVQLGDLLPLPDDCSGSKFPYLITECALAGVEWNGNQELFSGLHQLLATMGSSSIQLKVVGFSGLLNLVQFFWATSTEEGFTVSDLADTLAKKGLCKYTPLRKERHVYSRDAMIRIRDAKFRYNQEFINKIVKADLVEILRNAK